MSAVVLVLGVLLVAGLVAAATARRGPRVTQIETRIVDSNVDPKDRA